MNKILTTEKVLRSHFWLYIGLSWLHMLSVIWPYYHEGNPVSGLDQATAFHGAVWLTYSALYLLPAILTGLLVLRFLPTRITLVAGLLISISSVCILFFRFDSAIYDLYRFHLNGFVLNLITTPGGVESLGGGHDTYVAAGLIVLGHILLQILFWPLSRWLAKRWPSSLRLRSAGVLSVLMVMPLGERFTYGLADIHNQDEILSASKIYPFYNRVTFRKLAASFGLTPAERSEQGSIKLVNGKLKYPLTDVVFEKPKQLPNIIILVAESLRWDRLTPEYMPNTWRLAQKSLHFNNHYSSGNGTREGLFGLFYGLYGSYWSSFLHARQGPLLMDRLKALDYQFDIRTSARFSYPEFDKTLFAAIPRANLHEANTSSPPWQRDHDNATALIDFIGKRDPHRPFMGFFFFESTHARYDFPEDTAIAMPYLKDLNYATMSRDSLKPKIAELLNRYTNSAHWIDIQMGRIYDALEQQGLLENTILVVTGDHGEEFMEKGFWGHNSSFVEEQVRTPLVVSLPGMGHRSIESISSHLDISPTLLHYLGAPKAANTYSLGRNLLDLDDRQYIVTSDWHSIGVIMPNMKYRIAYTNRGTDYWAPTTREDVSFSVQDSAKQPSELLQTHQALLLDAVKNTSIFMAGRK